MEDRGRHLSVLGLELFYADKVLKNLVKCSVVEPKAPETKSRKINTSLPPRSFDRIRWLKTEAGFSTVSQILMKGIDILYAQEITVHKNKQRR